MALHARDWREFDRPDRIGAWDALAQWASEPNPFYESWYLLPSLEALDPDGAVTLLAFEVDGQLAGLLPLIRGRSYYGHPLPHCCNWVHANCFLGTPLVMRGLERHFWRHVLEWCDAHPRLALFLHLVAMPATGPLHHALTQVLTERARPAARVMTEERALLAPAGAVDDCRANSLSPGKRKELRRQHRRLAEEGEIALVRQADAHDIEGWIAAFLALEACGWKGRAGSAIACDAAHVHLFTHALTRAALAGRLERLALTLDGRPIAMLANFLAPPGAFSYKTAFDEDYARFSPGVLLQRENLALLDRANIAWADSCAAPGHAMIEHIWRQRRTIARYNIGIGGPLRRRLFALLARLETGAPPAGLA